MTIDKTPTTSLCKHSQDAIRLRDADIVKDLLGRRTFTEVLFMQILGREPRGVDMRLLDACMVAVMEHGLTPSAIATRLVYMSAPENLQGGVAAGLLAVGSQFVGTMENCSRLLDRIAASSDARVEARVVAREHRERKSAVPGFGHHLHKPDDPRAKKLIELARAEPDFDATQLDALEALASAVDEVWGRHVTINATGATAALLGGLGILTELMRGFAVISRAAGLVAHIAEEQQRPSGRFIWETIDHAIPFEGDTK